VKLELCRPRPGRTLDAADVSVAWFSAPKMSGMSASTHRGALGVSGGTSEQDGETATIAFAGTSR
jgi:hypothetical protein